MRPMALVCDRNCERTWMVTNYLCWPSFYHTPIDWDHVIRVHTLFFAWEYVMACGTPDTLRPRVPDPLAEGGRFFFLSKACWRHRGSSWLLSVVPVLSQPPPEIDLDLAFLLIGFPHEAVDLHDGTWRRRDVSVVIKAPDGRLVYDRNCERTWMVTNYLCWPSFYHTPIDWDHSVIAHVCFHLFVACFCCLHNVVLVSLLPVVCNTIYSKTHALRLRQSLSATQNRLVVSIHGQNSEISKKITHCHRFPTHPLTEPINSSTARLTATSSYLIFGKAAVDVKHVGCSFLF